MRSRGRMSLQIRDRVHWRFASGVLAAGAIVIGCSGSSPKSSSVVSSSQGCDPSDPKCGTSGAQCGGNADCASGACASGVCTTSATGPDTSGTLNDANSNHLIFDDSGDQSLANAGSGGDADNPACPNLNVDFNRVTPTVMLLIDQSGSMQQSFENGVSRWNVLTNTLTDPQNSLLAKLDSSVRFGMTLYTSEQGFGPDPKHPKTCPELKQPSNPTPVVNNFAAMSSLLKANGPKADTPTAESIAAVAQQLTALGGDSPKSIILATDGDPDTCADPNANNSDDSKAKSVAAVTAAYQAGIATHVISVGNEITQSHLQNLAIAGSGGDPNAVAYTALDTSGLVNAFQSIIGAVRTCDFKLQGTVTPENAPRGTVLLDGTQLTFGDPNGWEMPDQSTVRLLGQACETVEANANGVSMKFPCDAITLLPR
jgi:hypothetical protein